MRKLSIVVALLALSALGAGSATAQRDKPDKSPGGGNATLTIAASPAPVVFGRTTLISGRLRSDGGQTVVLEQKPHPFTGNFEEVATATTASNGGYSFRVLPRLNTRYRVISRTSPPVQSAELLVQVRIRVSMRLSDYTPRRRSLVRFSGSAAPAHDGAVAEIQRLRSTGGYGTIARTRLRDAGSGRSVYSRRIRISRTGTFRVVVRGDADHATGFSRRRTARVG